MHATDQGEVPDTVIDMSELRDRIGVFADRAEAGRRLADLMADFRSGGALVLGIPAGGVPVAAVLADELELALDVAVVSKITLPWNREAGYGAVAFDGSVKLNEQLIGRLGIADAEVQEGVIRTRARVGRRVAELRGDRPLPEVSGRTVILTDDGLASGFTMLTAVAAVRSHGPSEVVVAVPTAHTDAVRRIMAGADRLYCCNLRGGMRFAVASAYRDWHDVSLEEVARILDERGDDEPDAPGAAP